MEKEFRQRQGFTLIELLIVLTIITILFAVVFVALNPPELFAQSRNSQRWVHVSQIVDAVNLYAVQNAGDLPNESFWSNSTTYMIGTATSGCNSICSATSTQNTCLNLSDLVTNKRLSSIPIDPLSGTSDRTGFYIRREGSLIYVGACEAELGERITHSR